MLCKPEYIKHLKVELFWMKAKENSLEPYMPSGPLWGALKLANGYIKGSGGDCGKLLSVYIL